MNTRVMIAEDNFDIFLCYQRFLEKEKNIDIVCHASDGESAVFMYKQKKPDVLLLDLGLPLKNRIRDN